jgi:hypothetical protein
MRAIRKAGHPDAERTFARRLTDGDNLLKEIDETKSCYGEAYFSDTGQREAALEGLRTLGVPRSITWPCEAYAGSIGGASEEIDVTARDFFKCLFMM